MAFTAADYVDSFVLTAGSAVTVTKPADAVFAVFSATGNFYANFNGGTASAPSVSVTDGTASMLNPAAARIAGLTSFSIVAPAAANVVIAWYNE